MGRSIDSCAQLSYGSDVTSSSISSLWLFLLAWWALLAYGAHRAIQRTTWQSRRGSDDCYSVACEGARTSTGRVHRRPLTRWRLAVSTRRQRRRSGVAAMCAVSLLITACGLITADQSPCFAVAAALVNWQSGATADKRRGSRKARRLWRWKPGRVRRRTTRVLILERTSSHAHLEAKCVGQAFHPGPPHCTDSGALASGNAHQDGRVAAQLPSRWGAG